MEKLEKHPLLEVLEATFSKSIQQDLELNYYPKIEKERKWICLSDYCVDDRDKPNDVVTFSLLPYIHDLQELSSHINLIAPKDIKHTREVSDAFVNFLKDYPLTNFSFIINERSTYFGRDNRELIDGLHSVFSQIRDQYKIWIENQPEKGDYYRTVVKKLNKIINHITQGKKIKQIYSMLITTYLGAFVSALIVKRAQAEIFGWLSDRDAINEVSDHVSIDLFEFFMYGFSQIDKCQFVAAKATSMDKPFYDELLRIPDYIAGTLADFNIDSTIFSKPKFKKMLTNYMAGNTYNNFIFKIQSGDQLFNCARMIFPKKED